MAIGPLARVLLQGAVMGISILARALPAAYGAALRNARKGGIDAASAGKDGLAGGAAGVFSRNRMPRDEALAVLNLVEAKGGGGVDLEAVQKQYDKYFAANAVEKGGSFYLQSKIYRAKEMLDEFIHEKRAEEEAKKNEASNNDDNDKDKKTQEK